MKEVLSTDYFFQLGFHFHNFFSSNEEIHHKYLTYGHAWHQANDLPLWELHKDIALGVDCAKDKYVNGIQFSEIERCVCFFTLMTEKVMLKSNPMYSP